MKYRPFNTNFWEDGYIEQLTDIEKLAFIFLFTNSKVNKCGIYEITDKKIIFHLGINTKELTEIKQKFKKDQKFSFFQNYVFIHNFSEHNKFSSAPNVLRSLVNDFNSIPVTVRDYFFNQQKLVYSLPTESKEIVIVIVNVIVNSLGGSLGGSLQVPVLKLLSENEDIDPSEIKISAKKP